MSVADRRHQDISGLSTQSLNNRQAKPSKKAAPVADSWEDSLSESDTETERTSHTSVPNAPPPTPLSPTTSSAWSGRAAFDNPYTSAWSEGSSDQRSGRRPEKQTATANRLIAGALGVRATRTEEQRTYDRAVREAEQKKKDREKEEKLRREEEVKKAKESMWND